MACNYSTIFILRVQGVLRWLEHSYEDHRLTALPSLFSGHS